MKFQPIPILSLLLPCFLHAQKKDSLQVNDLKEVVITGQYNAQSVDKSVFEVEVITQKEIKQMAGNNLADVLTQTLNISIVSNPNEGRSGISMFGFSSEYVKNLVDCIPLIGDERQRKKLS